MNGNMSQMMLVASEVKTEWEKWRTNSKLEFFNLPPRGDNRPTREGGISADEVRAVWHDNSVIEFGLRVIRAHEYEIGDYIDAWRMRKYDFPHNETNPEKCLLTEEEIYGRNVTLTDELGVQINLRPDYILGDDTVIDCKYTDVDTDSPVTKVQAYLSCLLAKEYINNPRNRFVDARDSSIDGMNFFLKIYEDDELSPFYRYERVTVGDDEGRELLINYARAWRDKNALFNWIKKQKKKGFYLPEPGDGKTFLRPAQPNLISVN